MSNTAEEVTEAALCAGAADGEQLAAQILRTRDENARLQEYLDRIFGIQSAIIYILDASGHFTFVNRAVEGLLNFTPEELIGKHFSFILPPEEYERVSREVVLPRLAADGAAAAGETPKLFNERRTGDRRTRNMEVRLMTRRQGDYRMMAGDVTGIVEVEGAYSISDESAEGGNVFLGSQGVIFDITKFKRAEHERLELYKRLYQLQKLDAIGKLAGRVAHDLNNKLGSIIGVAEMIKQELDAGNTEHLAAYADTLLSASRHAAELSTKWSEYSRRGESGYVLVNFHELLDGVLELVASTTSDYISIRRSLRSKNPSIMGSETMLRNAMLNVVVNGIEAIRPVGGGVITIETADVDADHAPDHAPKHLLRRGKYLMVSIRDNGVGMDEETKEQLFDPFFTTSPEKGVGLGLLSFRECVRSHGGIIDIHSEPGQGARFDMYLPKASDGD